MEKVLSADLVTAIAGCLHLAASTGKRYHLAVSVSGSYRVTKCDPPPLGFELVGWSEDGGRLFVMADEARRQRERFDREYDIAPWAFDGD